MVTALAATIAVTSAAFLVVYNRAGAETDSLGASLAMVTAGKPGTWLVHERQKIIVEAAAAETFSFKSAPTVTNNPATSQDDSAPVVQGPVASPGSAEAIAEGLLPAYGFSSDQWGCLYQIWEHESGWNATAENPSGAYGIPQALPGDKMASAGPDWQTNATTQIKWGLGYIQSIYGTPCDAWSFWQAHDYY
jgi:Transglycosylase SLT domain